MEAICRLLNAALIVPMGFVVAGTAEPDVPIVPDRTIKLFNGRDLSGWTTWLFDTKHQDPRGVYSVRDGMLRISGDGFGYLSTDRAYKDYRLVVELKWGTQNFRTRRGMARDAGIFLHSVGPDGGSYDCGWGSRRSNTGPEISSGAYKAAIECQVMEGGFGDLLLIHGRYADGRHVPVRVSVPVADRRVAADYAKYQYAPKAAMRFLNSGAIAWINKDTAWQDVPGFRGQSDVESPHGEWTAIECVCSGDQITVLVNGKRVNEACEVFPASGKILLQCEGSEILFRKIELHPVRASVRMNTPLRIVALGDSITNGTVILEKPGYHAKHEQFSRDGRNRVLIQLNQMPGVKVVLLSELDVAGSERPFPADRPYTLRPTGHEAWIGITGSIFFSTTSPGAGASTR